MLSFRRIWRDLWSQEKIEVLNSENEFMEMEMNNEMKMEMNNEMETQKQAQSVTQQS